MQIKKILTNILSFAKRKKWFIIIGLIIVAIVWFSIARRNANQVQYITDTVSRITITESITETGNIISDSQTEANPLANGIVKAVYVKNGDYVYKGQPLYSTDSIISADQKNSALAAVLNAESAIKNTEDAKIALQAQMRTTKKTFSDARYNYTTILAGFNAQTINLLTGLPYSKHEVDSARAALSSANKSYDAAVAKYNSADASIDAANQSKTAAELTYEKTLGETVNSPISGTVTNLNIAANDKVSASLVAAPTANSLPPMIIANMKRLSVKLPINEVDITKVALGQTASVTCDAIKDKTFSANVSKIDSIGTSSQGVITYNVYLNINEVENTLRPAMSANVNIEVARHENVLAVPNSAIKPYQGGKAVQVLETTKDKQSVKYVLVKIGIRGVEKTEILEGLQERQSFIIANKSTTISGLFKGN